MKNLLEDLMAELGAVALGHERPASLQRWLSAHAQELHTSRDQALKKLSANVGGLLAEHSGGDRTDSELAAALRALIPAVAVRRSVTWSFSAAGAQGEHPSETVVTTASNTGALPATRTPIVAASGSR